MVKLGDILKQFQGQLGGEFVGQVRGQFPGQFQEQLGGQFGGLAVIKLQKNCHPLHRLWD